MPNFSGSRKINLFLEIENVCCCSDIVDGGLHLLLRLLQPLKYLRLCQYILHPHCLFRVNMREPEAWELQRMAGRRPSVHQSSASDVGVPVHHQTAHNLSASHHQLRSHPNKRDHDHKFRMVCTLWS